MNCRMRKAADMLLDARVQVPEVVRQCGYDDPGLFTRTFKKKIGLASWSLLAAYLDFLNEPLGKPENGMRIRFRADRPSAPMCVRKGVQVVVHLRVMFGQPGTPVFLKPVPLDEVVVVRR
jgi:hypothetical protein